MPKSIEWLVARYLLDLQLDRVTSASAQLDALLAAQNEDGGWGWLLDEQSNAFGTGIALYALSQVDSDKNQKAIEDAQRHLVSTQDEDGSWPVPSTKKAGNGKPKPTSNYWGTAWGVIGLCRTN